MSELLATWRAGSDRERLLQIVQPGLIGLIDGTISTLAPIFAAAYLAGSREALLVGIAAALGAAISMGMSEGLSDDGELTGRGTSVARGLITGVATFIGGSMHALPFLIGDINTALTVAYIVVSVELRGHRLDPEALPEGLADPLADPGHGRGRAGRRRRRDHRQRLSPTQPVGVMLGCPNSH